MSCMLWVSGGHSTGLALNVLAMRITVGGEGSEGARIGQTTLLTSAASGHHEIIASKCNCLDNQLRIGAGAGSAYLARYLPIPCISNYHSYQPSSL